MNPKILIGEMAKLHNVSEQTLRYYDRIGLFKPLYIDKENNYRYYGVEQFAHLDSILFLKRLGMSLKNIRKLFEKRDLDSMLLLLQEKEQLIEKEIQLLNNRQRSIRKKVQLIQGYRNGNTMNQCRIKKIPSRKMVYLNLQKTIDVVTYEYGIKELNTTLQDELCLFNGVIGVILDQKHLENKDYDYNKGVALVFEENMVGDSALKTLPAGDYAAITFKGSYEQSEKLLETLLWWIDEKQYMINGDGLVLAITDAAFSNFEDEYITEIQIPIKKA
ncbi:MerR family transcriptional regulator [Clostridiaceae bacterium 35-E11]